MEPLIAKFFLAFSHETIILPLIILGYIWGSRDVFYHAICLMLTSMILNFALKITFKIPLHPSLSIPGFAFPSGHMQSPTVLYSWIAFRIRNLFVRIFISLLLLSIGISLVYSGYHNYYDIFGAVFFAAILLLIYSFLFRNKPHILHYFLIIFSTILMIYIGAKNGLTPHMFLSYYALLAFIITDRVCAKSITQNFTHKLFSTILCFATIFIIKYIFSSKFFAEFPYYLTELQWAAIGFTIPWSKYVKFKP